MFKNIKSILLIVGLFFLAVFILINPSILGKNVLSSLSSSNYNIVKYHMFSYYFLIMGIIIFFGSFLFKKYSSKELLKKILLYVSFTGILITVLSLLLSPEFLVRNFTESNFLVLDGQKTLSKYRSVLIILGCLISFLPLALYIIKFLDNKISKFAILVFVGLFIYAILYYFTSINSKYPSNIILNSGTYSKVKKLLLGQDILLSEFDPISTLKVKRRKVVKAKYPVIDMNFHMRSAYKTETDRKLLSPENLVKSMDSVGLQIIVNSDGFRANIDEHLEKYPDRFIVFDPTGFPPKIMTDEELAQLPIQLEEKIKKGAKGDGEIWKYLGLRTRDKDGNILSVDDPRIDPFWAKAGELGVPILWHMIDVPANFQSIDKHNERFIMLSSYPEFSHFSPGEIPPREVPIKDRENVFRKHPETIFIGCHMGMNPNDLEYVGYLLDTYPNYYVEISTVLSELGRQPYTAREFFIKYQDRIMFGTDGGSLFGVDGWTVEKFYQAHWEFLETDNEYIEYPMQGAINQGSWRIYGLNLPDSVLEKVYYKNAAKILNLDLNQFEKF